MKYRCSSPGNPRRDTLVGDQLIMATFRDGWISGSCWEWLSGLTLMIPGVNWRVL